MKTSCLEKYLGDIHALPLVENPSTTAPQVESSPSEPFLVLLRTSLAHCQGNRPGARKHYPRENGDGVEVTFHGEEVQERSRASGVSNGVSLLEPASTSPELASTETAARSTRPFPSVLTRLDCAWNQRSQSGSRRWPD